MIKTEFNIFQFIIYIWISNNYEQERDEIDQGWQMEFYWSSWDQIMKLTTRFLIIQHEEFKKREENGAQMDN